MIKCKKCGAEDSVIAEFSSRDYGVAMVTKIPFEFPKNISWTSGDELAEEVIKSED